METETFWSDYDFSRIPFHDIMRVGQRSLLHQDLFSVSWLLGRFCNYRCSYCWPYARSDRRDHRPTELLISTMNEIKRQARERSFNSFHFSFSGGEPSLHPGYFELLANYVDDVGNTNYQSLHMTTNLSPGLGWWKKYATLTHPLNRVSITASFHKEFAQKEAFVEKLIFLQQHNIQVTINMVMVPGNFEILWQDALYFHEHKINVTLKPQSDRTASQVVEGYSQEQLHRLQRGMPQMDYTRNRIHPDGEISPIVQVEMTDRDKAMWYMDQAERFNSFGFNRFCGWECSAGYRSVIIREPDGNIKRGYSCHDAPLGNITTGFSLFADVKTCQTPSCVSSADSKIPKRKAGAPLPLWPGDKTFERLANV